MGKMVNVTQSQVKSKVNADLEREFQELASQWKYETGHFSFVSQMIRHPAYQRILDMGEPAITLILRELQAEPWHWFLALSTLSGESPHIPDEDRGRIRAIAKIWIEWGKTKGYIE